MKKPEFDPTSLRNNALREGGVTLRFYLGTTYDANRPMGNIAASQLSAVIRCWLLGLHVEIEPIIHRSNRWLDQAILEDEDFSSNRDFHRSLLHWARAMGTFLEDGWNDEGHWYQAQLYEEAAWRYERRPWPAHEIIKEGLDDYMAFAYQGGEHDDGFAAGIAMYERWVGEKPLSLNTLLKPREFGYAICLHIARGRFARADLFEAGRRMLQANLEETWLGGGQYLRAATWLKIVYELQDEPLTPLQVILKAYDNTPNIPRPSFV